MGRILKFLFDLFNIRGLRRTFFRPSREIFFIIFVFNIFLRIIFLYAVASLRLYI